MRATSEGIGLGLTRFVIVLIVAMAAGTFYASAGEPARAAEDLSVQLGVDIGEITIVRVEFVEWTDGCFGLRAEGDACPGVLAAIPYGNVTWVAHGDDAYRYHGSQEFTALRQVSGPISASSVASLPLPAGAQIRTDPSALPATGSGGLGRTAGGDLGLWLVALSLGIGGGLVLLVVRRPQR